MKIPGITEVLTEEITLLDVVKLAVNNDMVAVLKIKTLSGDSEMQLIATGHLQGNEEWMAYYKHGKNTIVTKHTDGKYWRFDRDNYVSKSVVSKRAAIIAVLTELGALPGLED